MKKGAFTLIELILVIVIIGILSKFGIEFLAQAYKNFIFSTSNNELQIKSSDALETISARLQYRIKDSVIARENNGSFSYLNGYEAGTSTVLEWIGMDIDGFRGDTKALWSGIMNLNNSTSTPTSLLSPETNTTLVGEFIDAISDSNTSIDDIAIYFINSNIDQANAFGWSGAITDQNATMHPLKSDASDIRKFTPINGATGANNSFSGLDVYEYYQLAHTAYAVVHDEDKNLWLHYDYQPWRGESYLNSKKALIMQNVSTFRFRAVGALIKIQVCAKTDLLEDYSLCKEKTIY